MWFLSGSEFDERKPNPRALLRGGISFVAAFIDSPCRSAKINFTEERLPGFRLPIWRIRAVPFQFFSKIRMRDALQIIDEEARKDLELIRQIRNAFAHSMETWILTASIVAIFDQLSPDQDVSSSNFRSEWEEHCAKAPRAEVSTYNVS